MASFSNENSISTLDIDHVPGYIYKTAVSDFNRIGTEAGRTNFVDYFSRQRKPTAQESINDYKRFAYACANINAHVVSECKYKLYVKTQEGQKKPRAKTVTLTPGRLNFLKRTNPEFREFSKDVEIIEEVITHPILDLLNKVNESPFFDEFKLREFTQLYQEICGKAYWWIKKDILGRISEIWLLQSQFVEPKKSPGSKNILDYYEYKNGKMPAEQFLPEEIIQFLMPNLNNPYLEGFAPLEAAWEDNLISNKMISHESGMLDNQARPDVIATPKEAIGEDQARLFEKQYQVRFGRGRGGGMYALDEPFEIKPLNWPPRDLARLEIHETTKKIIANAYGVPLALVESQSINRATLEAAQVQHGRYSIRPRLARNCSVLNKRFLPAFDDSGRLFIGYDDPVPEDEALKTQKVTGLVAGGIITANEARAEYDYPPHPEGDRLISANQPADFERDKDKKEKKESDGKNSGSNDK